MQTVVSHSVRAVDSVGQLRRSTLCPSVVRIAHPLRGSPLARAYQQRNTSNDFSSKFEDQTRQAKKQFDNFVDENQLKDKAQKAANTAQKKFQDVFEQFQESASRKYKQMDSEYQFTEKAERAAKRLDETWRDVDQSYSIRRKARNATEYLQKKWPVWQRQLDEFSATW